MALTLANMAAGIQNVDGHVRHLLRHLNDSAALRKNGLVASLFGPAGARNKRDDRQVVGRIREMVLTVSRSMLDDDDLGPRKRRWHDIIVRCDIGGELHKQVADELAIGMRQFYRERKLAREYLAAKLEREIQRAATATTSVHADAFALALGNVGALRHAGQTAVAATRARTLFDSSSVAEHRVVAAALAAEIHADQSEHSHAGQLLDEARRVLAQSALTEEKRASCVLRIDAAEGRLLWDAGSLQRARAVDISLIERFEQLPAERDHSWDEFALDTLFRIAWRDLSAGDFEHAARSVTTANAIAQRTGDVSAHIRAATLIATGTLRNIRDADDATAALFAEALELCQRNGLSEDAMHALIALSVCQQLRGFLESAVQTASSVLAQAQQMCAPVTYGLYCLRLAELHTSTGNPSQAVAFARRAAASVRGVQFAHVVANLIDAEAHLAQGAYAHALKSASVAESEAGRQSNARMQGTAFRAIAEAMYGLGHAVEAGEYAAAAISLLERAGHPYSLHRAYRSSAKITGKRAHATYADQIERELLRRIR